MQISAEINKCDMPIWKRVSNQRQNLEITPREEQEERGKAFLAAWGGKGSGSFADRIAGAAAQEAGNIPETGRTRGAEKVNAAEGFKDWFPGYKVITKTGNCQVSRANWQRTDFPFWEYFKEGTDADSLNDWEPSGPQPPLSDAGIQRNLSQIGAGKISLLIPEKLQEKMDADPAYAEQIYRKVAKWKEDYDAWDNATAASLGMDVTEHQLSKSYCIQLDEDGNVENATVCSGGRLTRSSDTQEDNWKLRLERTILYHKRYWEKMEYGGITELSGGEDAEKSLKEVAGYMGLIGFNAVKERLERQAEKSDKRGAGSAGNEGSDMRWQ